eukprot:326226-Chlamydomonas_euryale.AAC.2
MGGATSRASSAVAAAASSVRGQRRRTFRSPSRCMRHMAPAGAGARAGGAVGVQTTALHACSPGLQLACDSPSSAYPLRMLPRRTHLSTRGGISPASSSRRNAANSSSSWDSSSWGSSSRVAPG